MHSKFQPLLSAYLLSTLAFGQQPTQNILANGGFESGLMCFSTNIWNTVNAPFASDYKFSLTKDSHSGANALEITCLTKLCEKAAIISSKIQTSGAQPYVLSVYSKCPAGRTAAVYVPGTQGGDTFVNLSCNGNWTPNTIKFTTGKAARDFFFYIYNRDVEWLRLDDIVLTFADRPVPAANIRHAGLRDVSISGSTLSVDGNPYFALGFFDVPYDALQQVADLGANTINGLGYSFPASCSNTGQPNYLDRAYELNLNFLPDSSSSARLASPDAMTAAARQFGTHLANIGWYLSDEPDQERVPAWFLGPEVLTAVYQAVHAQLAIPVLSTFQHAAWSVPADAVPYAPGTDIYMAEPYGPEFSGINTAINTFNSLDKTKPIWLAQDDPDAALIVPKAYWATISGATGILYFTWDAFKGAPAKLAAVTQVFAELNQLKPVIFATPIDSQVTPPDGIRVMARSLEDSQYILAANPKAATIPGTFTVSGLAAGTVVQVMFEDRTITAADGSFEDTFTGVSRHVYFIAPTPTAKNKMRRSPIAPPAKAKRR